MDVLGENEALQQFFEGQDVTGVLDSAVVDTSILEQYLSNMDPTFMLPESPPDSGSEPCSPPQIPDVNWSSQQMNQESLAHMEIPPPASCRRTHEHFSDPVRTQHSGLGTPAVKAGTSAAALQARNPPPDPRYLSPGGNYVQQTSTPPLLHVHTPLQNSQSLVPGGTMQYAGTSMSPASSCLQPHSGGHPDPVYNYVPTRLGTGQQTREVLQDGNKRRRSDSFEGADDQCHWRDPAWKKPLFTGPETGACDVPSNDTEGPNGGSCQGPYQLLTWDRYQFGQWNTLYNSNYESLPPPAYHVDTDKGFNYSSADEAFVCQKKNHFQVTIHVGMVGEPKYVKIQTGLVPIDSFCVKVFGIKLEAQNHFITIEQSQADRSKKPFLPVKVNLPGDKITKVTLGRLHFSETTANNMRKKGKPNPDQRYFMMVVGLYATVRDESHLVVAYVSERIIVRTSNPGQFENESEVLWQRGQAPESVVFHGRVGINTDTPDEALVVCGNARIMGTVMHPSDKRAKQNIFEVDSTEQLKRISQMRIVEYDYKPEFAAKMGIDHVHETGVIAQEVKELLPTAVREVGDVTCSDGGRIPNFLMVDKEQIFMENVGAVKQLCKLTDNLEERIQELEVWNTRLAKLKNLGSLRSKSGPTSKGGTIPNKTPPPPKKPTPPQSSKESIWEKYNHCLQHRVFQASIIMLVTTMAFCIISITALYLLTLEENLDFDMSTNTSTLPPDIPSTTKPPAPWPPDLDFSGLFYSEDIQCCPSSSSSSSSSTSSSARNDTLVAATTADLTPSPNLFTNSGGLLDHAQKKLIANFKKTSDWTNTTINSILITQNQQRIDKRYCQRHNCRPGDYTYDIPVSKFVPVNMPVTLLMNTSELLVIHLCGYEERAECSALMDYSSADIYTPLNTQGYIHMWPVPVARYYRSSYHFRATVAGQADCDTHQSYRQVLFTDYRFHFHRRCD